MWFFIWWIATVLGFVVMALAVAGGLWGAFTTAKDHAAEWQTKKFHKWFDEEIKLFAQRLANDAFWFSEDAPTMKLLMNLANEIQASRGLVFCINPAELRDKWYEDRKRQAWDNKAAKDPKEAELKDLLSSARCIAERKGAGTDWETFAKRIADLGISGVTAKVFLLPDDDDWDTEACTGIASPAKATDLGQQPRPGLYENDSDKFLPKAPIKDD
jgi:hypothetical protein